jgi:hypothetical protein
VSQSVVEAEKGIFRECIGSPVGVDLSPVESLIGIDVSHASQEPLVQQKRLDGSVFCPGSLDKFFGRDLQGLGTQVDERNQGISRPLPVHEKPAELTLVYKTKLARMILE